MPASADFLEWDITAAGFVSVATAILFAYVVNKLFVFESRTPGIKALLIEFAQFVGARFLTMLIEVFGVLMLHDVWKMNDMAAKLVIQVVVMVVNYIFSKLYVFKEKTGKNGEKDRKRRNGILALCFFIPAVTMGVAFALNGVFPFGDRGVLIIDSLHQYLPFFTEFHEKLANNETLLYSFGGGLGFNFWATFAYYLASPLNLIVTFFPKSEMMDVMALLIVLRIGLCGLTFGWYMLEKKQYKNGLPVMFACMYALSSFIIGYYFNLMWLDSIAMLPLVMCGIERIVDGKSGRLFGLSLFYGLYCNYYIGFMLCLFSCLYFLVIWIGAKKNQCKKHLEILPDLWLVCPFGRRHGSSGAGACICRTCHHRVCRGQLPVHLEALCAELIPADQPVCFCGAHHHRRQSDWSQCFLRCCDHDYGLPVCTGQAFVFAGTPF